MNEMRNLFAALLAPSVAFRVFLSPPGGADLAQTVSLFPF